jgi:hypothetical protein
MRIPCLVGSFSSSRAAFWSACQDAVFLYAVVWAVTKALAWVSFSLLANGLASGGWGDTIPQLKQRNSFVASHGFIEREQFQAA